jgi:uncharacterized protein
VSERGLRIGARIADLAAEMRALGGRPGTGELITAERALTSIDPSRRNQARLALRATLCSSRIELEAFDHAFARWSLGGQTPPGQPEIDPIMQAVLPRVAIPAPEQSAAAPADLDAEVRPAPWAATELLREKDFADYTPAERRQARVVLERIARRGPRRISRRTRASRHRSHRIDARATLRSSLRHAGEPFERRWRDRVEGQRPLVLVLDISGSMEPYSRVLLQYAQACTVARRRCEAFAFGTRLTRITHELSGRDPDLALERAGRAVADWSAGTRIGDSLAELNRAHGRRIGRGAVVCILSDGWDRGDPKQLAGEVARLARCSHRLVWLNPLKASPGFEPLTRGMTAALPHVDEFMAGNSIASLEALAALLEAGATGRRQR